MTRRHTALAPLAIALAIVAAIALAAFACADIVVTPSGRDTVVSTKACEQTTEQGPYVVCAFADVTVDGKIPQGVMLLGGKLRLADGATVENSVVLLGATLDEGAGARVKGDLVDIRSDWVADAVGAFCGLERAPKPTDGVYHSGDAYTLAATDSVTGDLVVAWCDAAIAGRVDGSVIALGSNVTVEPDAEIRGDLIHITSDGEKLKVDDGALVRGKTWAAKRPQLASALPPAARAETAATESESAESSATVLVEKPDKPEKPSGPMHDIERGPVLGGNITIRSGERCEELLVMGGNAEIEEGAEVAGDVVVLGGNVENNGLVTGDVAIFGGNVHVGSTGVIQGEVMAMGGQLDVEEGASVEGPVYDSSNQVRAPEDAEITIRSHPDGFPVHVFGSIGGALADFSQSLLWTLLWLGVVILVGALWPGRVQVVSDCIRFQPARTVGLGLLYVALFAAIALVLGLVTCGLAAVVSGAVVGIAHVLGTAAVGLVVGEYLVMRFRLGAMPTVGRLASGAGAVAGLNLILGYIPVISVFAALAWIALALLGLGAVFASNWGANPAYDSRPVFDWFTGKRRRDLLFADMDYAAASMDYAVGRDAGAPAEPPEPRPEDDQRPTE